MSPSPSKGEGGVGVMVGLTKAEPDDATAP